MPAGMVEDHPTDRRLRQELRKLSAALDKLGHKYRRQGLQLQAGAAREQYWKSLAAARQAAAEQVRLARVQGCMLPWLSCILLSQQDLPPAMTTADRRGAGLAADARVTPSLHSLCAACNSLKMSCLSSANRRPVHDLTTCGSCLIKLAVPCGKV